MREISKEEYLQELEDLKVERSHYFISKKDVISRHNFEDPEYETVRDTLRSLDSNIRLLNSVFTHLNYIDFDDKYHLIKEYFENKYKEEVKLPQFLNEKISLLENKRSTLPNMESEYHPYCYDDPNFLGRRIENDVEVSKEYFEKEKKNFVYTWELQYLVPLLYYEKLKGVKLIDSLFSSSDKENEEVKRLHESFEYVFKHVKEDKKLPLSLFLSTIYDTYHHFFELDSSFVIGRENFILISDILESGFLFFNYPEYEVEESSLTDYEKRFISQMCGLLSNDMVNTIMRCFPDYYSDEIMFLGYGCYTPAGCSDLTTSMKTFEEFIKGICDYDFWCDDKDVNGEDILLKKLHLKKCHLE